MAGSQSVGKIGQKTMQECLDENYCIDFKERVAVDMGDSSDERNNIPEDRAKIRARWEVCKQCKNGRFARECKR